MLYPWCWNISYLSQQDFKAIINLQIRSGVWNIAKETEKLFRMQLKWVNHQCKTSIDKVALGILKDPFWQHRCIECHLQQFHLHSLNFHLLLAALFVKDGAKNHKGILWLIRDNRKKLFIHCTKTFRDGFDLSVLNISILVLHHLLNTTIIKNKW